MSRKHSIAMDLALDLYRGTEVSADRLVQTAEMIRLYREGRISISLEQKPSPVGLIFRLSVNDIDRLQVGNSEVSSPVTSRNIVVVVDKFFRDLGDKIFSRHSKFFAHTNSSSVATGDESVGEVATPSRAKRVGDDGEGGK